MMSRWKYSLRTLLGMLTVIGLLTINIVQARRIVELNRLAYQFREKARIYESRAGVVEAGDPDEIQVLNVEQTELYHWHWRLRAAPETELRVHHRYGNVGVDPFEKSDGTVRIVLNPADGEVSEIDLRFVREPSDSTWYAILRINSLVSRRQLSPELQHWLNSNPTSYLSLVDGVGRTSHHRRDRRFALLRQSGSRSPDVSKSLPESRGILPPDRYGIHLWCDVVDPPKRGEK